MRMGSRLSIFGVALVLAAAAWAQAPDKPQPDQPKYSAPQKVDPPTPPQPPDVQVPDASGAAPSQDAGQQKTSKAASGGPAIPPENEKPLKKPSRIKRALRRAAPNCIDSVFHTCWSRSAEEERQREAQEKEAEHQKRHDAENRDWEQQQKSTQKQGGVPENQPVPRSSDEGSSSSKETKLGLEKPSGSAQPSESDVSELRAYDPHRAEKNIEVGDFYFKRGNYKAASSRYREALEWKPNDAVATFRLAEALEKDGQFSEARTRYAAYLKILPKGEYAEKAKKALQRLNEQAAAPDTR